MIHAFTSAAANYLPKVRLLRESLQKHHPEIRFHWLLADAVPDGIKDEIEELDSILTLETLGLSDEFGWLFQHNLIELSTALKPLAFSRLSDLPDCQSVLYFDPDMVVFSQLGDLLDHFQHASILLTPHQVTPDHEPSAIVDNEIGSLRHGIFNLGFLGLRNDKISHEFVDWWANRLRFFCLEAYQQGVWVDQRWIDHVPVFFDRVQILRNPRFNVAAWNISQRRMEGTLADGITIEGQPLGFYHFSGYDSGAHKIMAAKYARRGRSIKSLLRWYDRRLAERPDSAETPWAFGSYSDGTRIPYAHRFIYRMRQDLQAEYPNPFQVTGESKSYLDWATWRAQVEHPDLITEEGGIDWGAISNLQLIAPPASSSSLPLPFNAFQLRAGHYVKRAREAYLMGGIGAVLKIIWGKLLEWL